MHCNSFFGVEMGFRVIRRVFLGRAAGVGQAGLEGVSGRLGKGDFALLLSGGEVTSAGWCFGEVWCIIRGRCFWCE